MLWLEGEKGKEKIGIIDFKEEMIGKEEYDVE